MKFTGIVKVRINADLQRSEEGAELEIGGVTRTSRYSYKREGFTEKPSAAKLKFRILHAADTDLVGLQAIVDSSVEFATDTGVTYLITNATVMNALPLKGGDQSGVDVEMEGDPAVQI